MGNFTKPKPCNPRKAWYGKSYPGKPPLAAVGKHYLLNTHACQQTELCRLVSVGNALVLERQ